MRLPDLSPPRNIGISISESPDMRYFGFSDGHLKDAMAGFAIHLLASGANLAYGGDLRDAGFSRLIFDLVLRYRPHRETVPPVANYLAWPVHATMTTKDIRALDEELQGFARLVLVGLDGSTMSCEGHRAVQPDTMDQDKWCVGLTAMRELMREQTDARLVLGGKLEGYKGVMPGIAEEALLAIGAKQPVFLVGGFGGCARDIAETLGIVDPWAGSRSTWQGRELFSGYTASDLNNGLTPVENRQLAATQHVNQAITLVMIGLRRLRHSKHTARDFKSTKQTGTGDRGMATDIRNVFISHVHEDDPRLTELKGLLRDNGIMARDYSVSSDNPNNAHSERYIKNRILGPRIRRSGILIVYVSRETKDSEWVNWEIQYAKKKGKRIVGILASGDEGCDLPDGLAQYGDALVEWRGDRVVDAINGELDRSTLVNPPPGPSAWSRIVSSVIATLRKVLFMSRLRR